MDFKQYLTESFPIGVKYGQHRDMEEKYWDTDFANMRDCGMEALRIHAFWAPLEPEEGKYDFAQYDRIVAKAGEYGLKVMFTLYLVAAPEWVFEKHPDSRFVSASGIVWGSEQCSDNAQGGWPGLCFDSEPFRETVENFVSVFVTHFKGNPNILAIDIWHEPTDEANQAPTAGNWKDGCFCYCEHSQAKFRTWLEEKYGSLEGLNKAWTRHYNRWDQVHPPKNLGIYTDWLDWRLFRIDALTDSINWLNGIVKKYDPDRATSVHVGIYEMDHPSVSSDDHFKIAGITDMFACSMYDTKYADITGFTLELMRSACDNGPFWIGETETGSGPMFSFVGCDPDICCFSRPVDADEIFKLVWSSIAHGAKGIFFWGWRPDRSSFESISLGFTERDGALTERTEGLKKFTALFRNYRRELAQVYAPESDVCVVYNMDSMIHEGIVSFSQSGSKMSMLKQPYYKDVLSFFGCYRLCMKNGIQPDIINKDKLNYDTISKYRLMILPYDVSVTVEAAKAIEQFVKNGGKVISDAMLGFFTDGGWASEVCPPHGLDQVFGLRTRSNYELMEQCGIRTENENYQCVGRFIRERCQVYDNAAVLGHFPDEKPAYIRNTYGKGTSAYIAAMFFANVVVCDLDESNRLFNDMLKQVGYEKDKEITGICPESIVEVRRLLNENVEYIFVMNHSDSDASPTIDLTISRNGKVKEIFADTMCEDVVDRILHIHESLKPMEVKVYRIE